MIVRTSLILAAAIFLASVPLASAQNSTTRIIADRWVQRLTQEAADRSTALKFLKTMRPDGSWSDISYADKGRAPWAPAAHLQRILEMAEAYRADDGPLHADPRFKDAVLRAVHFWVVNDPTSANWWYNDIYTAGQMADILLLVGDDLPASDRAAAVAIVHRSTFKMTGANLTWEAGNLFRLAAATGDLPLLEESHRYMTRVIAVTAKEGVQADWSFHQHGAQLNSGNYGLAFLQTCAEDGLIVRGTPLALSPGQIEILRHGVLDFQQWVVWKGKMDLSSTGRQLDNPRAQSIKAHVVESIASKLAKLDPDHAAPLNAVASDIAKSAGGPVGDRYFWRSDFLVHRPARFYFSVKMHSRHVLSTETNVNSENLKGYHLSDGVTLLMIRGDEYADIQPVWNWRRLPGVTFLADESLPLPIGRAARKTDTPSAFVGGVSDATAGLCAMDFSRAGVHAKKAWFCFGDQVVCLGAGLSDDTRQPLTTTLNQCLLKTPPQVLRSNRWTTAAAFDGPGVQAVWHDNVGYLFPAGGRIHLTTGPQTGAWTDIHLHGVSNAPITQNVFTLTLQHAPADASYVYTLLPNRSPQQVVAAASAPRCKILSNTAALQAVADPSQHLTEAVFHSPGSLQIAPDLTITTRDPVLVLLRQTPTGLLLTVADPTQSLKQLRLRLTPAYHAVPPMQSNAGPDLIIPLPTGELAGSSVSIRLTR